MLILKLWCAVIFTKFFFLGGMNHALSEGNQLASEMDGASRPTWDPNNFDIPEEVRRWQLE